MTAAPGDRVVVRFRKGAGAPGDWRRDPSATASDVTGVLVAVPDNGAWAVDRDGEIVSVPAELVMSVRVLSDRPVRNSEIRALERAAARGWPGFESTTIGGWFVRAGGGFSRRANSAVPLERGATLDGGVVEALSAFYADRDLSARCAVVERLIPSVHVDPDRFEIEAIAMVRSAEAMDVRRDVEITMTDTPSDAWIHAYLGSADRVGSPELVRRVVTASMDGSLGFASVTDAEEIVAIGRGAVTTDESFDAGSRGAAWNGITCLWTDPRLRGSGVGTAVIDRLLTWGREFGAEQAYLQVETTNTAAIRLYRRLGFIRHHTYGYLPL
ncbi:MAG: GNAT family N-acetyltransferase [Corynebacteriales bacterium]|uniref:GNAT family N-acetyltransferase n=1 Tax=Williamsia herbipolensis TaxID=1603258 RepID=A0AAU4JZT4_9NOCA|nr:GNAT family N-acetyltransferase [Williamsia herbipolensis]MCX6468416.1 GNAT family N-acetyltransferase [Mycobacteriales bacterium]